VPTSDDKLLQQLIGKKAAKLHLEAKRASKHSANQAGHKSSKPQVATKKEESDDEEEGRASMFKSKTRKTTKVQPVELAIRRSEVNHTTTKGSPSVPNYHRHEDLAKETEDLRADDESDADDGKMNKPKSKTQQSKAVSYLDQLLTERSKKKKKKTKSTTKADV
jgi:hypothetical protein